MPPIPDLVQISKLETHFDLDSNCTRHVRYETGTTSRRRRIRKEEKWSREKGLGHGSSGVVWLERCIQGDHEGQVRAVKEVRKPKSDDYYRELEAIALFSHTKVGLSAFLAHHCPFHGVR